MPGSPDPVTTGSVRVRDRGRVSNALVMAAASEGVAQEEDDEQGIDQQDIFDRMVFFLAAITRGLFSRVLGADNTSFRPVMGKRGESGVSDGCRLLLQRADDGGGVGLRDTEPLGEGSQGTGRGIAEGAQGRQQCGQEDVNPLIGFALAHAEQASLHHLERIRFEVDQNEKQAIFRGREGAVFVHGKLAGRPGFPIEAPRRHMGLERRLEGRDQVLKLVERQTRQIQELGGAGLRIGELYTGHPWCLLSWEA